MTIYIKLTIAGADTGPFDLYSNLDSYATPFEIDVPRQTLVDGALFTTVPDGTTKVKILSTGEACDNYIILDIIMTGTTTTTQTSCCPCTTTTTTTAEPTTTTTTTIEPLFFVIEACPSESGNFYTIEGTDCPLLEVGDMVRFRVQVPPIGNVLCGEVIEPTSGPADATLYDCIEYLCGDDVHCDIEPPLDDITTTTTTLFIG